MVGATEHALVFSAGLTGWIFERAVAFYGCCVKQGMMAKCESVLIFWD